MHTCFRTQVESEVNVAEVITADNTNRLKRNQVQTAEADHYSSAIIHVLLPVIMKCRKVVLRYLLHATTASWTALVP